ncbi:MAG: response regulator receiver protein [Oleiphilus sp.]|nr:MAG: response regulator receiver protein [Oleiphilus sp.]
MTDDKQANEFAAALDRLKQAYIDRLPGELSAIEAALAEMEANQPAPKQLENMRQLLHKMAGSSGTFGLRELGAQAKEIEQQIKAWQKVDKDALSTEDLVALGRAFNSIKSASLIVDQSVSFNVQAKPDLHLDEDLVRLWLVEDDAILAGELKRQFDAFGFSTTVFPDITSADKAAKTAQPDALVLDVMFDNGAVNATEVFASTIFLSKLACPVIFMSAYDDFASRIRAVQLNAKGYFLKPISVPSVVNHLRREFEAVNSPDSRILIIDDDVELARHFQLLLQASGFDVRCLFEPEEIIEVLGDFNPEVVLMDLHMPKYNGMELAGVIRQHSNWMSLPILYLSGETDLEAQANALAKGAEDFLTKPISDIQLVSTIRARVMRSRQLEEKISRDSLTGLLKHAVIKETARHEVRRAVRSGKPCSLVMLDIDHFKLVNDSYGHAVGDVVISAVATVLQQRLRKTDLVGRYGGEEFVAVLPECDSKKAMTLVEEIRKSFEQLEFCHDDRVFHCTFSAGVICSGEFKDLDGEQLLISADNALYHAKENGRNQVALATEVLEPVS